MRASPLLVLSIVLAGCSSGGGDTVAPQPSFVLVTAPSDYSADANGSDAPHLHDYWGGQDRLTIVDQTVQAIIGLNNQRTTVAEFQPRGQVVVPQGTARVEVKVDWAPNPDDLYSRPELWVRTAQDHDTRRIDAISKGGTVTIHTNQTANDIPHQELSAWMFHVKMAPPDTAPFLRFNGRVSLEAIAYRGLEIPLYPAHPDQWKGRDTIPLFKTERATSFWLHDDNICMGACLGRTHVPVEGGVVPLNHSYVEAKLTVRASTPNTLGLLYHAADTRTFTRLTPSSEANGVRTYQIMGARGDGAYALQTLWDFGVVVERGPETAFSGSYQLEAAAHRLPKG